ncbi:alpha/beta hydrolase [Chryseobacterium gallinarum]|uniref:Alpha/beta hydrolase n=1 Tax=Chryseobacterium gallinarum TaxID=1324352 RepID=A0ABX6KPV8_CHRGL|nr:alpha/beta hydrolase-fold protein [Chryseobacterium gallinarum]QIY90667.1 alpha/beta hydrolase [Chryseobacterium gallinarum]
MKHFITITLFLLAFYTNAQQNINIGKKDSIFSKILGETRSLRIYTPDMTSKSPDAISRYPVLYVLDGDAHFYSTVGIVQQLSQANGNSVLPEMIIVGIESTNRLKDFTPIINPSHTVDNTNSFVQFLAGELIPFIEKNYNTAPYKMLAGHSLGGLLAMDILCNHPNMFNAYIAIEPSMWYGDEKFLNQNILAITKQKFTNSKLFIGIANTMPQGMDLAKLKNDASDETKHIRAIFKLSDFLKKNTISGLKYKQNYYSDDNHNSVSLISEYDGLRFIFDYYRLSLTEKDLTDSTPLIASKIKMHYEKISKEMGYKVTPPEAVIQYFGYEALAKNQQAKAAALFKLNIDNYPESSKVYDAYADYCVAKKDTVNAVKYYKMSLSKNTDPSIQHKLSMIVHSGSFNLTVNDLQKYATTYTIMPYNIDVEFYVRENQLWSKVIGESEEALIPVSENVFTLKNKKGYTITFKMDGNKVTGFTSVQPDGTFKAVVKSKLK